MQKLERLGLLSPGCREVARRAGYIFVRFHDTASVAMVIANAERYGEGLVVSRAQDSEWPKVSENHPVMVSKR